MNVWPRSDALRANVKFWRQCLRQGHYQATYQQARKGFTSIYLFYNPLLIFILRIKRRCWWCNYVCAWFVTESTFNLLTLFPLWLDQSLQTSKTRQFLACTRSFLIFCTFPNSVATSFLMFWYNQLFFLVK